jgi:hypothetical protein
MKSKIEKINDIFLDVVKLIGICTLCLVLILINVLFLNIILNIGN